jgi:hypothetical protein
MDRQERFYRLAGVEARWKIGPNALEEKIGIPAGVLYFSCRSVEGSGMGLANDPQQWRGGHYFLLELGTSTDRGKSYIYMGRLLDVSAL